MTVQYTAPKISILYLKNINDYVLDPENKAKKQEARPWHYWICQKQRGKFADIMKDLIQRKIEYKESGVKLKVILIGEEVGAVWECNPGAWNVLDKWWVYKDRTKVE